MRTLLVLVLEVELLDVHKTDVKSRLFEADKWHFGDSFYYAIGLIVKLTNKRLLKTMGFAIRMPNLDDPELISKLDLSIMVIDKV